MKKDSTIIVKKLLKSVMLVMTLSMLISILGMMIDGIIIGRFLGTDRTAAYGLVSPVLIVGSLFSGLLSSGAVTQLSQYRTKGDSKAFNSLFSMTLLEAIVISLLMIMVVWVFRNPLSVFLGATGDKAGLQVYMLQYIAGLLPAMPLILSMELLSQTVQLDGGKKLVMAGIFVMLITDVVLDLMNVFLFKMDMFGMALATTVSYYASAAVIALHFFNRKCTVHICLKELPWNMTGHLIWKGVPGATGRLMSTLRSLCLNRVLVAVASSIAVAAYAVNNSAGNIMTAVANGVAGSCVMLVGIFLSDRDYGSLKNLLSTALKYAFFLSVGLSVLFFAFSHQVAGLFLAGNPDAVNEAAKVIRYYSVYTPLFAVNSVFYSYLQGIQNVKYSTLVCIAGNGGLVVVCAFILGNLFGADGVWMAFPVSGVLALVFIFVLTCIYNKHMPHSMADFAFLPHDREISADNILEKSVTDRDQITDFSETVRLFCLEKSPDRSKALWSALCIEEILKNSLEYGCSKVAHPCIDTRITYEDGSFAIRFRDNCNIFNPKEYFEQIHEDGQQHLGLKMVFSHAVDVRYSNVLQMNNLIVKY